MLRNYNDIVFTLISWMPSRMLKTRSSFTPLKCFARLPTVSPTLTVCEVRNSLKALRTWRDVWLIWTNNQLFSSLIYFGNMDLKVWKLCSRPFTFSSYKNIWQTNGWILLHWKIIFILKHRTSKTNYIVLW